MRTPIHAPDARIAELAERQHGVVSRRQLLEAGLSTRGIQHRLERKRLHRVHPGVYAVGHARLLRYANYMAAVLACGEDAVLSHRAAGALLGLNAPVSGAVEVTVPCNGSRKRRGILVHASRSLPATHVTECDGIPVTAWFRTLVDLAGVIGEAQLRRALHRSAELNLFDRRPLEKALACMRGRRGVAALRLLLDELPDAPPDVRSELERRFLDLVRAEGLPMPDVNVPIGRFVVDFCWRDRRFVVETDGRATHDTPFQFEADRRRDLELTHAGWQVVRVTWRQVTSQSSAVAAMLRARLRAAPVGPRRPHGRAGVRRRPAP